MTLPPLREVIARHGLSASKALGQNFLLDRQLLARIAAIPGGLQGASVYEVGPGPGGLTAALLEAGANVVAVERDRRCLPALAELQAAFPDRLTLVEEDALKVDERIVADAGDDAFGRLAVAAQWRCEAKLVLPVHRSAFTPPPKVASAVVHLTPIAAPDGVRLPVLEALTAAAFGQRRKMLRQSLKSVPHALDALASLAIAAERRAETVSVAEWVALARILS